MNPGLRYLLAKGPTALARRMRRRFRGPRGIAMLVGMAFLIALFLFPQVMARLEGRTAEAALELANTIRGLGPTAIVLLVLLTSMRGGVHFKPAEIQFLFPAPIARRELLVYDALSKLRTQVFSGLWLSVFVMAYTELWYAAMVAAILVTAFWQLSAQTIGLLLAALEARFGKLARRALMLAVTGLIVAGAVAALGGAPPGGDFGGAPPEGDFVGAPPGGDFVDMLERFASLPPVALLSSVARPLIEVYLAGSMIELLFWTALSIGLLGVLLGLTLAFDFAYTESALERSQQVARSLARMRSGGGAFAAAGATRGGFRMPALPFLGGAGPIAWRQMQELARNRRGALMLGIFMLVFICIVTVAPSVVSRGSDRPTAIPVAMPLIMLMIMMPMMTTNLAFDFRRDLDRMPLLKSLPISGFALAAGQILPTALLLSAWEVVGIAVIAFTAGPIDPALLLGIVLGLLPLNAVLVSLDNVLFLLMPYRIVAKDPGRIPFMGRLMIVTFLKILLIVILAALAAIPAVIAWAASGRSVLTTALAVALFLLVFAVPMTFAVAAAFKAFDVSRDIPD